MNRVMVNFITPPFMFLNNLTFVGRDMVSRLRYQMLPPPKQKRPCLSKRELLMADGACDAPAVGRDSV